MDLLVLAIAHQANAARAAGARDRASAGFRRARGVLLRHRVDDREIQADLDQLEASLAIDLRQFDHAEALLANAALNYGLLRQDEALGRVLMKLSNVYTYSGRIEGAIEADRRALDVIDATLHPRLYLLARANLAYDLNEAGDPRAARDLLAFDADLYERHAEPDVYLRMRWLEGRIAAGMGDDEDAERALLTVRDGFNEQGLGFEVASVSLDLAALYQRQGRLAELSDVAVTAVALFEAQAVHRDALAALVLLRDAVLAGMATADSIRRVAGFLEELRRNPGAHLEPPN